MEINKPGNGTSILRLPDCSPDEDNEYSLTAESMEEEKKALAFFEQLKPKTSGFVENNTQVPDEKNFNLTLDLNRNWSEKTDSISKETPNPCNTLDVKTELLDDVYLQDSVFHFEFDIKNEEFLCEDMVSTDEEDFYKKQKYTVETDWEEPLVLPDCSENPKSIDLSTSSPPMVHIEKLPRSTVNTMTKLETGNLDELSSCRVINYVQRYCHKCKKVEVEHAQVSKSKNCKVCSEPLIYVCTRCNEKCYLDYQPLVQHWKSCKSKQTANNVLNAIVIYRCSDCKFRTLRELSMGLHITRTGHYSKDADEMMPMANIFDKAGCTVAETKIDFSKVVKRYCSKCMRTIAKASSTLVDEECPKCNKRLIYICTSCETLSNSIPSMWYHLRTRCFPNFYKCNKCLYTANYWMLMVSHLRYQHTEQPYLNCENCGFRTKYKYHLIKHITTKHADTLKKFCCEICYNYRTNNKKSLKYHVIQMHFT